jgi:hypothetical protein
MTLQALHDYSGREAAEAVRFDVRWKVAIGTAVDDEGFDPSTLVYWRNRIARSERPHRVNDAVGKVIEQTGVLAGRRRRAVDSTVLADAVATQDTVTQLISAVRRVAREVPGAKEKIAQLCTRARLLRAGEAEDRLGRSGCQGRAGFSAGQRRQRGGPGRSRTPNWTRRRRRRWRCWPWLPGKMSSPRRALRAGRAVADRPQGRRRPGDLHRGPRCPAHPQIPRGPPGRLPGACGRPARTPGSSPMRS